MFHILYSIDANERIKVAILQENLIKLLKYYKFIELYHRFIVSWIFFIQYACICIIYFYPLLSLIPLILCSVWVFICICVFFRQFEALWNFFTFHLFVVIFWEIVQSLFKDKCFSYARRYFYFILTLVLFLFFLFIYFIFFLVGIFVLNQTFLLHR